MKKVILLSVLLIFFPNTFLAQTNYGLGATPCSSFVTGSSGKYFSWAQGFISATSIITNKKFHEEGKFPDTDAWLIHLEKYCKANPLHGFGDAVAHLAINYNLKK